MDRNRTENITLIELVFYENNFIIVKIFLEKVYLGFVFFIIFLKIWVFINIRRLIIDYENVKIYTNYEKIVIVTD